jgi:hypothetical protein
MQVHKENVTVIPNALPNRNNLELEIVGMEGIPEEDIRARKERAGYREDGSEAKKPSFEGFNAQAATAAAAVAAAAYGYPAMPGIVPGLNTAGAGTATNFQVPRLPGAGNLPGVSHPQVPLLPSVPAIPSILSMPPVSVQPAVSIPVPSVPRPSVSQNWVPGHLSMLSQTTQSMLFPSAAQSQAISKPPTSVPVPSGDFKPLSNQSTVAVGPQVVPTPPTGSKSTGSASSRIVHPEEDMSLVSKLRYMP